MSALTPRQRQCLDIIENGISRNGVSPDYQQIADAMGLVSKSGVHRIVGHLEARGAIRRVPGRARAIALVDPSRASDALAFLDADTLQSVRKYARRHDLSPEAALAAVARKYFMGRAA